jgi:hypothetical protein
MRHVKYKTVGVGLEGVNGLVAGLEQTIVQHLVPGQVCES